MPLILAIEPDRRQANQVNAVVRGRLHADLVLAESAQKALAALGSRIPDLILTSAFLSPNDEVLLGEHLRKLDDAAAHVHTLTIPVLGSSRSNSETELGGMLGALRRGKSKSAAPDGCDPDVFADQCREYLARAEAERLAYAARRAEEQEPERPAASAPLPSAPAVSSAAPVTPPVDPAEAFASQMPKMGSKRQKAAPRDKSGKPVVIDTPAAAATVQEAIARLQAFAQLQDFDTNEPAPAEQPVSEPAAAVAATPEKIDEFALSEPLDSTPDVAEPALTTSSKNEPDVYEISSFDAYTFSSDLVTPRAPSAPVATPAPKPAAPDPAPAAASAAAAPARHSAAEKRAEATRSKPVQDEWGFFDPEQAGFAALLAKLEEVVDSEEEPPTRRRRA